VPVHASKVTLIVREGYGSGAAPGVPLIDARGSCVVVCACLRSSYKYAAVYVAGNLPSSHGWSQSGGGGALYTILLSPRASRFESTLTPAFPPPPARTSCCMLTPGTCSRLTSSMQRRPQTTREAKHNHIGATPPDRRSSRREPCASCLRPSCMAPRAAPVREGALRASRQAWRLEEALG
jgi:hypothetical protein